MVLAVMLVLTSVAVGRRGVVASFGCHKMVQSRPNFALLSLVLSFQIVWQRHCKTMIVAAVWSVYPVVVAAIGMN